jgi:starch synthase (maltosyl-transferring)
MLDRLATGDGFPALLLNHHPDDPDGWPEVLSAARAAGFGTALLAATGTPTPREEAGPADLARFVAASRSAGLQPWLEIIVDRIPPDHRLATDIAPAAFRAPMAEGPAIVDPRKPLRGPGGDLQLKNPALPSLVEFWQHDLTRLSARGVAGFAVIDPTAPGFRLAARLRAAGFRIEVLRRQLPLQADDVPLICAPTCHDIERGDAEWRKALADAALRGGGWAMVSSERCALPAGADLTALRQISRIAAADRSIGAASRDWFGPRSALSLRSRATGSGAIVVATNHGETTLAWPIEPPPGAPWAGLEPIPGFAPAEPSLAPRETVLCRADPPEPPAQIARLALEQAADPAARIRIAQVTPSVDQGRYAVKRVVWEPIIVRADIFADGHEKLAAAIATRAAGETDWTRYPLTPQPNDAWIGEFRPGRLGAHEFLVEAWLDVWGGFTRDFGKKRAAGQDLALDVAEARQLLQAALARAPHDAIAAAIADLQHLDADPAILLDPGLARAMAAAEERRFVTRSFVQKVSVEREAARFSSWYELFPRSQSGGRRHGSFADVQKRLAHIAAMGFDTLYFPPIHPIGTTNRKGRNNSLKAEADDVGSPYAIGSAAGGHDSVHPDLGTIEDFRALVAAARAQGVEIALDFAVQCSPDHPWLKQHPEWFDWRPDGSLKYAENPPKKYEDIVNLDFYAPASIPGLWEALRDVVLFWAGIGVRAFRVDNPHTKPAPFWEWLIAEVKAQFPDALFLAEAFTRPNPMYHLAKLGFSQSYSYFTWRHSKAEFEDYLTELTQSPVREFFRPHFFVNTPDINPYFLQGAGRPGFLIRAALAATLSGLFGVYAGFELCESAALPGREEYLDSEKYEIRPRPDRAPGDIVDEITQLNRLRREEPALQSHLGVSFHNAFNDRILYFSKAAPDRPERILVAISLDPFSAQEAAVEVPLWLFGRPDDAGIEVEDLLSGRRFRWIGKSRHLRLEPTLPYGIWRLNPEREA